MVVEINHPELLNRCIRCKDTGGIFTTLSIEKILGTKIIQAFKINFSVCDACIEEIPNLRRIGIEKYIKIKKDGRVLLKDPINRQASIGFDILKFYNAKFVDMSSKTSNFCPYCGSQQKTYSGFCAACGKNLKIAKQN